jgi:hypothetical protein
MLQRALLAITSPNPNTSGPPHPYCAATSTLFKALNVLQTRQHSGKRFNRSTPTLNGQRLERYLHNPQRIYFPIETTAISSKLLYPEATVNQLDTQLRRLKDEARSGNLSNRITTHDRNSTCACCRIVYISTLIGDATKSNPVKGKPTCEERGSGSRNGKGALVWSDYDWRTHTPL